MNDQLELAEEFDRSRGHLRAVAYRMLGSADEADDAVQEAWLRAARGGPDGVVNVTGWLTTIVGRVCLDMLRSRKRRREEFTDMAELAPLTPDDAADPEDEAVLADSVGLALLVVLDRLGPAERVAFVLHDLFAVPFDEIAEIVERSPVAAKKLASRARHRVHGTPAVPAADPAADIGRQRKVVEAFLAASRAGDLDGLLAVLDPDVVRRSDRPALPAEVRGARRVAEETLTNTGLARYASPAFINGALGLIVAPRGRLLFAIELTIADDHIAAVTVTGDPARLRELDLTLPR